MTRMIYRIIPMMSLVCLLGACQATGTRYMAYGSAPEASPLGLGRQVEHFLSKAYWREAPDCVVVAPVNHPTGRALERTLQAQLSVRFDRVIGPSRRDHLLRNLALDFSHDADRRRFMSQTGCRYVMEARPWKGGDVYALVWSEKRLGFELVLRKIGHEEPLWRARHETRRAEGGLPLSPLSAGMGVFSATRFETDQDVTPSMLDDLVRRMVKTLPIMAQSELPM